MNSPVDSALVMPDVQSAYDSRQIAIQRVGIRGVRHPFIVACEDGSPLPTVAQWTLTVALPADQKGTHMSRFVALLEKHRRTPVDTKGFAGIAAEMLGLLNAERGELIAAFPYFVNKTAPISGVQSLLDYEVQWTARAGLDGVQMEVKVVVPVTSLCPCSKTISEYGAHNQRSHVTVHAVLDDTEGFSLEGLIKAIESEGSCELWGLLKRTDEKFVTEHAYDNPKFVEDLVRDVAARVAVFPGVGSYVVEAENFESIHNHSAYAVVEG
ncbi:GTP cyclohydrolase I FolE2 [Achromobacter sp. GG226]|uniref:GTP cyclohydrolase FolE2 n=1 Tax=Verticiella alkaliphila TaxID=2779529 RepID=UPI001C0B6D3B|nr:GTP cyclohydrolase FolE2 [Verticiella sp. GG226]MBU4609034.1 GTP cyclohydrolase I FolE2 [Verticiella sp. GG226]